METFIVRVWTPADGQPVAEAGLHGEVEHVGTGGARRFDRAEDLLAFLAASSAVDRQDEGEAA